MNDRQAAIDPNWVASMTDELIRLAGSVAKAQQMLTDAAAVLHVMDLESTYQQTYIDAVDKHLRSR